jgi:hypothetical protein
MVAYSGIVDMEYGLKASFVKILGADGEPISTQTLSEDTAYAIRAAAFDPINHQFLLLWVPPSLYMPNGAVLGADGSPLGPVVTVADFYVKNLDATFEAANQRYLVVGDHTWNPYGQIGQQLELDGTRHGDYFLIAQVELYSDGLFVASGSPGKSLVVWGDGDDIFGSIVETAPPAPTVSLSSTSLTFAPQPVKTTSGPQTVTLTNTGSADLTITSITRSGDFSQSNDCTTSPIAAGGTCTTSVSFAPTVAGTRSGTITITDNTADGTHAISLSGTGTDFSISASPSPQTVKAGKATTYSLSVTPLSGFTGAIALSCSGAPTGATCRISPASVTLNGTSSSTATASVTTKSGKKGTPKGSYGLTFTAAYGTLLHSATATLVVK